MSEVRKSVLEMINDGKYNVEFPEPTNDKKTHLRLHSEYRDAVSQKERVEFRHDLEEENKIPHTDAFNGVWDLAWDSGHAEGLYNVVNHYEIIVEKIIDPLVKAGLLQLK